jgi:hypothetical protein
MPTSSGFQINEVLTAQNTNTYLLRSGRNCIINGGMNIAQRNTSVAGITTGANYYTADRWAQSLSGAGTYTQTVQTISASDAPVADGLRNSFKVTCSTASGALAAGAYNLVAQNMEGINLQQFAKGNAQAKFFALSFWVRSNAVGTYIAELYDSDNTRTVSASYTISASNTWQKVRLILPADSIGALDNDTNMSLSLFMWLGAGSAYNSASLQTSWASITNNKRATGQTNVGVAVNNFFEFTGVQLEPNAVCTPFENEDMTITRAKCLRYFQRHTQPALRGVTATSFNRMALHYGITMRASPTITGNGGTMGFYDGVTSVVGGIAITAAYSFGTSTCEIDINSSGWTAGRAACSYTNASYTFALDLNAELL